MPQLSEEDLEKMTPEQIAELQRQNCPFCLIAKGQIPAKKVYEDDKCLAVLDINPANAGHIILFPKEHVFLMPQMKEDLVSYLAAIAKKLSQSILKAFKDKKVEGTNIFIANGAAAGQKAPHVLIHIIPRFDNDGLINFRLPKRKMAEQDMISIQKIIASKTAAPAEEKEEAGEEAAAPRGRVSLDTISKVLSKPGKKSEKEEEPEEEDEKEKEEEQEKEEEEQKDEEEDEKESSQKSNSGLDLDSIARVLGKK